MDTNLSRSNSDDEKPDWGTGDLMAMPANLMPFNTAVACGCHVFVAEHDPRLFPVAGPGWRYGWTSCKQFRRATKEDLDRLISIAATEVHREAERLKKLTDLRKQFFT